MSCPLLILSVVLTTIIFLPCRYFDWVDKIQDLLHKLDSAILHHEITYHALMELMKDDKILGRLCSMMCLGLAITYSEHITGTMSPICSDLLAKLDKGLLKSVPGQPVNRFFTVQELLSDCQVSLSDDMLELITRHVVCPTRIREQISDSEECQPQPSHDN